MSDSPNLAEILETTRRRDALLLSWYRANPTAMRASLVIEYRCAARGCLLLHVWRMRDVFALYQPAYKLSRRLNDAETVEAARAKRTRDGVNHWNEAAHVLDDLRGWGSDAGMHVQCDHFRGVLDAEKLIDAADSATPGAPTRERISAGSACLRVDS